MITYSRPCVARATRPTVSMRPSWLPPTCSVVVVMSRSLPGETPREVVEGDSASLSAAIRYAKREEPGQFRHPHAAHRRPHPPEPGDDGVEEGVEALLEADDVDRARCSQATANRGSSISSGSANVSNSSSAVKANMRTWWSRTSSCARGSSYTSSRERPGGPEACSCLRCEIVRSTGSRRIVRVVSGRPSIVARQYGKCPVKMRVRSPALGRQAQQRRGAQLRQQQVAVVLVVGVALLGRRSSPARAGGRCYPPVFMTWTKKYPSPARALVTETTGSAKVRLRRVVAGGYGTRCPGYVVPFMGRWPRRRSVREDVNV